MGLFKIILKRPNGISRKTPGFNSTSTSSVNLHWSRLNKTPDFKANRYVLVKHTKYEEEIRP